MQSREHFYKNEIYIHDMTSEKIIEILKSSAWTCEGQSITSAETNNDNASEPNLAAVKTGNNTAGVDGFADITFADDVTRILDVGGGKFDVCRDYMKSRNIDLLVYDPYNRSSEHNNTVKYHVTQNKVAAATSMSVLNVIAEPEIRLAHICTLKQALKLDGIAYFKIWPGQEALKGSYRPTVNSYGHPGYQANAYADRFLREVQLVFGIANTNLHPTIPNLIVACNAYTSITTQTEIEDILKLSKEDSWYINKSSRNLQSNHMFFSGESESQLAMYNATKQAPANTIANTNLGK